VPIVKPIRPRGEVNFDLRLLTAAERLWLWRHRQLAVNGRLLGRSGPAMSQAEAAEALGLSPTAYRNLELSGSVALSAEDADRLGEALGPLKPPPSVAELVQLARRRSGLGLTEAVEAAGVSRMHFRTLEKAGDESLVDFWERRGFFGFPLRSIETT